MDKELMKMMDKLFEILSITGTGVLKVTDTGATAKVEE